MLKELPGWEHESRSPSISTSVRQLESASTSRACPTSRRCSDVDEVGLSQQINRIGDAAWTVVGRSSNISNAEPGMRIIGEQCEDVAGRCIPEQSAVRYWKRKGELHSG